LVVLLLFTVFGTYAASSDSTNLCVHADTVFNVDQAVSNYLNTLSPEQKAKSDAYFEGGYWIQLWDLLVEILIALIFLSMGLSQWIKKIALKSKRIGIQHCIYIICYLFFAYLIAFPYNIYTGFIREHQYNLSNLTFGGWFKEEMISLALMLILGSSVILLLYAILRRVKQYWWIWGSGVVIFFIFIIVFITPVFISPLFNDYKSLPEGALKNEILSMARANGVPASDVYMFDASRQSTRISANVSGLGSTIRVSLNDNLLNKCNTAEIKSVMAHELGHYVLNHVYELIIYLSILIIIGFVFINWAFHLVIRKLGAKWNISGIADIGGLPLIMVLFSIYFFIAAPVQNTIIRSNEVEADYFGLNTAREPDGFASVAMKLSEYRKISPSEFEEMLFFDHPSGNTRVRNAMIWKAEHFNNE
jgi:STE24 endopeptidase